MKNYPTELITKLQYGFITEIQQGLISIKSIQDAVFKDNPGKPFEKFYERDVDGPLKNAVDSFEDLAEKCPDVQIIRKNASVELDKLVETDQFKSDLAILKKNKGGMGMQIFTRAILDLTKGDPVKAAEIVNQIDQSIVVVQTWLKSWLETNSELAKIRAYTDSKDIPKMMHLVVNSYLILMENVLMVDETFRRDSKLLEPLLPKDTLNNPDNGSIYF